MSGAAHAPLVAARVGIDPILEAHLFENHDAALPFWSACRDRILVHIDAHHDTARPPQDGPITIANFIRAAVDAGLVREIFWIVPDPSWSSARARQPIARHLTALSGARPTLVTDSEGRPSRMVATLSDGRTLSACALSNLPRINEPVLLDIDVDYFLIPQVAFRTGDCHAALPWCWPEDLIGRLRSLDMRTDCLTIAFSIEGGYTPLRWKYLGVELAARLRNPLGSEAIWRLMRQGAIAYNAGDLASAESSFREACENWQDSAAPHFALAHVLLDAGRVDQARALWSRARSVDPTYRTPYGNHGLRLLQRGALAAAERECRRAQQLDPNDPIAFALLGWLAARRARWSDAEKQLSKSLEVDPTQVDVWRLLGDVHIRQRQWPEARRAYERSLKLALSGVRSLDAPIATFCNSPLDPAHAYVYARIARTYERQRDRSAAIANYLISRSAGSDGPAYRGRLAYLYALQGNRRAAMKELRHALGLMPEGILEGVRSRAARLIRIATGKSRMASPFSLS